MHKPFFETSGFDETISSLVTPKEERTSFYETVEKQEIEKYIDSLIPEGFDIREEVRTQVREIIQKESTNEKRFEETIQENTEALNEILNNANLPQFDENESIETRISNCINFLTRIRDSITDETTKADRRESIRYDEKTGRIETFYKTYKDEEKRGEDVAVELANILILGNVDISKMTTDEYMKLLIESSGALRQLTYADRKRKSRLQMAEEKIGLAMSSDFEMCLNNTTDEILSNPNPTELGTNFDTFVAHFTALRNHKVWGKIPAEHNRLMITNLNRALVHLGEERHKLPEEQNKIILEQFKDHFDDFFGGDMGELMKLHSDIAETVGYVRTVLRLKPQEVRGIHQENWKEVVPELIKIKESGVLTTNDIENIQLIAFKHLIPEKLMGFRDNEGDPIYAGKGIGVDGEKVPATMEDWVDRANELAQSSKPGVLFYAELGSLYGDFIQIHPLHDGNGTTSVFVIEALAGIHGAEIPDGHDYNYNKRLFKALNNNWGGIALAGAKVKMFQEYGKGYKTTQI